MNILIISANYLPGLKGGGPIKTIKNLIEQTTPVLNCHLVTRDRDLGDSLPYKSIVPGQWNNIQGHPVFYTQPSIKGLSQLLSIINSNNYDILYLNSFFSVRFSLYPLLLSKMLSKQVVLAPRGELSDGALALKSNKKKIFITIFKALRLHENVVFQASSSFEKLDIQRNLGEYTDIFIAENITSTDFTKTLPAKNTHYLKIVFLSRIAPMKNLLTSLEVLKNVKHPVVFNIYGPKEDLDYWQKCESLIKELPKHIKVKYKGLVYSENVINVLSEHDVFLLTTKGENFGHVIAEALSAGLPLVISDQTPWRNLDKLGIGWDLPLNNLNNFITVIDKLASMPVEEHLRMREAVLKWAKQKFSQRSAIESNIAMFRYAYNKKKGINNGVQK